MSFPHVLIALITTAVWGVNFVVIKECLGYFPPVFLSALRFIVAALPILFLPKPAISWRYMVAYAVLIGVIKFSLVFFSISAGMPAGVAGLVLQVQVMFSVFLAALLFRERPKTAQLIGLTIAFLGVCVIAWGQYQGACFTSMLLLIIAAFAWSLSNFVLRQAGGVNMMHFMAWMSLVPPLPLLLLSAGIEGVDSWVVASGKVDGYAVLLLLYLSLIATVMAFGFWGMLMARYPTAQVAPFSLLVPVFGMTSASIMLGECYSAASFWGGMIALVGLAINVLAGKRIFGKSSSDLQEK